MNHSLISKNNNEFSLLFANDLDASFQCPVDYKEIKERPNIDFFTFTNEIVEKIIQGIVLIDGLMEVAAQVGRNAITMGLERSQCCYGLLPMHLNAIDTRTPITWIGWFDRIGQFYWTRDAGTAAHAPKRVLRDRPRPSLQVSLWSFWLFRSLRNNLQG